MENEKKSKLKFENIVKNYGKKVVINGLQGAIADRAITSLIGPNGAGKSTLLSILCRLLKQDRGDVFFDGKGLDRYRSNDLAKHLAILRQSNNTDMKLTVKDLVAFGRFPHSQGRMTALDWEKVDEALAFSGLTELANSFVDELSGGQRQRAFLALIIAQDTAYILLDEPLNNLDMKHAVQVMKTLRRLVDEKGKTVIMVIHEINFAAQYSDYIMALKNGEICYHDVTEKVFNVPILEDIFGINFEIIQHNGKKICNYFNI
ncbi:ABC transporter ATP-binding protein [Sphingobacterium sp. Mn56C]|uniref:iron ABC transporter ATP-binding protein n=1 Tax=Sphingobacterium sp. Mn56C TaxID=3395261 RepID=UPI003BEAFC3F